MTVNDITNFRLSVNNQRKTDLSRADLSLSLSDSIYRLSPSLTLTVPDPSGVMIGARAGGYGIRYDFEFEAYGKLIKLPFRADHFEVPDLRGGSSALSGTYQINLTHAYMFRPSEMRAYKNKTPGEIISSLISEFGVDKFTSFNLDPSSSLDMETIYNPNLTPCNFIEKILLPLSSATTNEINNPFYAFIDAQNRFQYKTLKSMLQQRGLKTLLVSNQPSLFKEEEFNSSDYQRVTVAIPFSQEYGHIYDVIDTETTRIENGEFFSVNSSFKNIANTYLMGFYDREKSISQYMSDDYFQTSDAMMRLQAGINYKNRKSYFIDKLVVSTILDLDLCAGTRVKLQSYFGNSEQPMISYTGEYIIESSVHSWNSNFNSGTTQLVLGTPAPYITQSLIASKAYGG